MLHFAICDDEPLMVQEIADCLSAYMEEKRISSYQISRFSSGGALLESGGDFDLIFLDIQMEKPDGMETAGILRRQGSRSLLVFVTVLRECVFDAFETEACGYLLKPLDRARFVRTMDRALASLERRAAKSVMVRRGASCEVIPLSQIIYCEVQGRKLYIHLDSGGIIDCLGWMNSPGGLTAAFSAVTGAILSIWTMCAAAVPDRPRSRRAAAFRFPDCVRAI